MARKNKNKFMKRFRKFLDSLAPLSAILFLTSLAMIVAEVRELFLVTFIVGILPSWFPGFLFQASIIGIFISFILWVFEELK